MRKDYQILLLGQEESLVHDLRMILEFMGEPVICHSFSSWSSASDLPDNLLMLIVSQRVVEHHAKAFLQRLASLPKQCPVIIYENGEGPLEVTPELKSRVISRIAHPPQHNVVMDALFHSQIAQEQNPDIDNSGTNRPLGLFRSLVGASGAIQNVRKMIKKVSASDASVLILGESGTGKEVVARNIHYQSTRRDKNFVPVNCGAIPPDLLESELFGHEKGAFTGAISARKGRFEMADGGTLFLDEIGDMPLNMQVKLLRVLQERCFERVGSNKSITVDVRIIAATHRHLEDEISHGKFREDLFYRLNVFPIELPPLHQRIEDLPMLINELITRVEAQNRAGVRFLPRAIEALSRYLWPGNVRELANLVERMSILYPNGMIDVHHLPKKFLEGQNIAEADMMNNTQDIHTSVDVINQETIPLGSLPYFSEEGIDLKEHLMRIEKSLIEKALQESGGVVARAAEFLKMRRTTLVEKMRKYGMGRANSNTSDTAN